MTPQFVQLTVFNKKHDKIYYCVFLHQKNRMIFNLKYTTFLQQFSVESFLWNIYDFSKLNLEGFLYSSNLCIQILVLPLFGSLMTELSCSFSNTKLEFCLEIYMEKISIKSINLMIEYFLWGKFISLYLLFGWILKSLRMWNDIDLMSNC